MFVNYSTGKQLCNSPTRTHSRRQRSAYLVLSADNDDAADGLVDGVRLLGGRGDQRGAGVGDGLAAARTELRAANLQSEAQNAAWREDINDAGSRKAGV